MNRTLSWLTVSAIAVLATLVFPYTVVAQSIWLDRENRHDITLEFYLPQFKNQEWSGYSFRQWSQLTGQAFFLTYRSQISENVVAVLELPYTRAGYSYSIEYSYRSDESSYETSAKALGNLYIGMESRSENSLFSYEFGGRIPILWDCHSWAADVGMFADFDRFGAFASRWTSIQSAGNVSLRSAKGFVGHARLAPSYMMCIGCNGTSAQLLLHYSAQVGYERKPIAVLGGFTGVTLLTDNYFLEHGNSSVYQLGFQANTSLGKFRPGVHFRFPLDDELREIYDFVWGLSLQYQFE